MLFSDLNSRNKSDFIVAQKAKRKTEKRQIVKPIRLRKPSLDYSARFFQSNGCKKKRWKFNA